MKGGNTGEWSEIYVFLRILADGGLYAADENLNKVRDMFLPIIRVFREEEKGRRYEYRPNSESAQIEIYQGGKPILEMPSAKFAEEADRLRYSMQRRKKGSDSFDAAETKTFTRSIYVEKLKARSADKTDIDAGIHDITMKERSVGFSIKSELGSPPTLLNASLATNFVYKVEGLDPDAAEKINSIDTGGKIKGRIKAIKNSGGKLVFKGTDNEIFGRNLKLIDRSMSAILAEMLSGFTSGAAKSCVELSKYVSSIDPLSEDEEFYVHKIKELLCAVALGMKPATKWGGRDEANGGYIIVNKEGDVLVFHIFNRDDFKNYLFNRTKFDTPSSGRHEFGHIYTEDGEMRIKLNLQIRFV